jgi:hypothetical protein
MWNRGRARTFGSFVGVLTACAFAWSAGCGGDDSTTKAKAKAKEVKPTPQPAKFDPGKLLLRQGEEPGFKSAGEPVTNLQPFPLPPAGAERLRKAGFISSTFGPLQGDGAAGASSITLFESAAGAREWMEHETTDAGIKEQIPEPGRIRRFTVAGVPGSRGWTGLDLHGNKIGTVFWTDGRCEFVLSNENNPPFVDPLTAGAKAWYARTKGMCPA